VANISSISSSIDMFHMNLGIQSYMHVQNLMNSLRDIRIFLGLVPNKSPCIIRVAKKCKYFSLVYLIKKQGENEVLALARACARVFVCCVWYKIPVHTTKRYRGTGVTAPLIRTLGIRWRLSG
jgi:hypothetical protein